MATPKKQTSAEAYKEIMSELQSGQVAPIYLLMGEESYYIDKVCDWITGNILSEDERDFNLTMFYGSDVTAQQIVDDARRYPVMAEKHIVVVRDAQALKNLDALEKYAEKPVQSTILVLCHMNGVIDGRKKVVTRIAQIGKVFISEQPKYDRDIIAFINDYIHRPEYNATIDTRGAQVIAAHIGGDLKRLTSELDKLLLSFAPGAPRKITADIIEQRIGISKQYNVFELRDALIQRDALRAHRIAKYYNDNPKAGGLFAILPLTFSFFQNLMLCYYIPKPVTDNAIMSHLGLKNTWAARDYITAQKYFTARKTLQIISKLREIDARLKGLDNVNTTSEDLLKELISFIVY